MATLALDHVAAIAGVPHKRVVAGAAEQHVVAATADNQVVAGATGEDVVAVAAVQRKRNHTRMQHGGVDRVIAGQPIDVKAVVRPFGAGDIHAGGQAGHGRRAARPGDFDGVRGSRAADDDGVGRAVAGVVSAREV